MEEGYPLFANNSLYKHEIKINENRNLQSISEDDNFINLLKSINLFISLKNDLNKNNQYLFSINSHNSMV